jgi:myo-inositol-1(or 4)-monophosphatase
MTVVDFEKFVEDLAEASGEAIMPFFRTALAADDKAHGGAFDPVTEADRAAELAMRRLIQRTFPSHGIIGEEFASRDADAEYVWVLDPIDGTKSFICGFPTWGTLIGLSHHGRPCYGMMHQPFTRERFHGDGEAAFWRGPSRVGRPGEERRKLVVRPCPTLGQATLMTTSPLLIEPELRERFFRVEKKARLSRYGGDCYSYCALAAGHVDLVIEAGVQKYDIFPLIPIIEGAGGVVTTWDGGDASNGGAVIAAGDRALHDAAMRLLAG